VEGCAEHSVKKYIQAVDLLEDAQEGKNDFATNFKSWRALPLTLTVRPPAAIINAADNHLLIAGIIALCLPAGMDQINFGHFGVIFAPQVTGFGPDVFHDHDEPPVVCLSVNFF
jgi:hypothetical protein